MPKKSKAKKPVEVKVTAYRNGDDFPFPSSSSGLPRLRLYSSRLCPFSHRVRLVLAHKEIPYELINIHLKDKPTWYNSLLSNDGTVPYLVKDGINKQLWDSIVICQYLDELYPGGQLLEDTDLYRKARDRNLMEEFGKLISAYDYIVFPPKGQEPDEDQIRSKVEQVHEVFKLFDEELDTKETRFYGGYEPGLLDFVMWPHMERCPAMAVLEPKTEMTKSEYRNLAHWHNAMKLIPAVQKEMFSVQDHLEIIKAINNGDHPADYGLDDCTQQTMA